MIANKCKYNIMLDSEDRIREYIKQKYSPMSNKQQKRESPMSKQNGNKKNRRLDDIENDEYKVGS